MMLNKSAALRAASLFLPGLLPLGCAKDHLPVAPVTELTVSAAAYDAVPRLALTPLSTLCDATSGDCDFGDAVAAEPDVAGGIVVWDYAKPLRRYNQGGQRVADLGRKGKGPGEYEIAVAAGRSEDGIAVVDIATLRIARFDSGGGFVRFDPLRNLPQTTRALGFVQGDLVVYSVQPLGDGSGSDFRAVRITADGSDTLARQALPGFASSMGQFQAAGLFTARPVWKGRSDGTILFSPGSSYEIVEYRDGHAVRRVQVKHAPRSVTKDEVDREGARRLARAAPQVREAIEDAIRRVAALHPAITDLAALEDGGLLAREAEDATADSVRWTRFDLSWNAVGHIMTAATARVLLVQGDRMLMQEQDSAGTALRWYRVP